MGHVSNYSEETAAEIDEEVKSIIFDAYQKTEKVLTDHIDVLHRLAGVLFEKEKLDADEFIDVIEGRLLPSGMSQAAEAVPAEIPAESAQEAPAGGSENTPRTTGLTLNERECAVHSLYVCLYRPAGVRAKRRTGAGQKLPRFSMPVTRSGIANPAERSETLWQKNRTMATRASRASRAPTACGCARRSFSARTASTAASTRSLRSSPTPSTRRRQGYGKEITITRFLDQSIEVEDHGRGIPVDFNKRENRYNWELVFCEMYAGGKYNNNDGGNYDFSLGLNGLGLCATQYASEYMDADIRYDGFRYTLHFERGENVGGLKKEPYAKKKDTGSVIRWKPDLKVFTDIAVPVEYYTDTLRRQAIVNAGVKFIFKNEVAPKKFETTVFCYENGIEDHVRELCGDDAMTSVQFWQSEKRVRDREDLPLYNVKINVALAFPTACT